MKEVCIVPCPSYEEAVVAKALEDVLRPIGGIDWVESGMTVVIKANLVSMLKPERAATTHPALLCALTKMLLARGAHVIIGDSPGGLYNAVALNRIYAVTGMKEVEALGAALNGDFSQREVKFEDALVLKDFTYTAYLDRADAIINVCKLKSHGMMSMSAGAKNMFGAIPGTFKPEYHFRFPNHDDFAKMIVDINRYFADKIKLCIADAVMAMEGNGPTQGTPRYIGALLASSCPHSLDLTCAHLIGMQTEEVPTLKAAHECGLIPKTASELTVIGNLSQFAVSDFENIRTPHSLQFEGKSKFAATFVRTALRAEPRVKPSLCVSCRECERICPAKVITMKNGIPHIDRKRCITCFCCQEFCPRGALVVHRPLIARILNRKS
ncbi:MAG: DUF362 domain-containing protein [Clostridia bacterium]|nr:DUF362 domain-containing protein [Clostridia bacterium]